MAVTPAVKLVKISPSNVIVAEKVGLAVQSARSWVVLAGSPAEALAALGEAKTQLTDRGERQALRTLERKLEQMKPEYVQVITIEGEPVSESETPAPVETPAPPAETPAPRKAAGKAEPKRAPLREGYTTPVGLAKVINERGLYSGGRGDGLLTSQSMYTYIKSNGEGSAFPFPLEVIDGRQVVQVEAGVAWWVAKEKRVAEKAEAAEAKRREVAEKRAAREAAKAAAPAEKVDA